MKRYPFGLTIVLGILFLVSSYPALPFPIDIDTGNNEKDSDSTSSSTLKFQVEEGLTRISATNAAFDEGQLVSRELELSDDSTLGDDIDLVATHVQASESWTLAGVAVAESSLAAQLIRGTGENSELARSASREPPAWRRFFRRFLAAIGANRWITSSNALEQETRRALYRLIQEQPGSYAGELSRKLGIKRQTATYHLRILEDTGIIVSKLDGRRYYYCNDGSRSGTGPPPISPTCWEIVGRLDEGLNTKIKLAEELDITPRGVGYHLNRLIKESVVDCERSGPRNEYELTDKGKTLLSLGSS